MFVEDEWDWKERFRNTTMSYAKDEILRRRRNVDE
jgi:hypothetical protein